MDTIATILTNTKTIAVIGMKSDEATDAFRIPNYMHNHGYIVFAVNPFLEGQEILGEPAASKITDLLTPVDLVNIFRRPEHIYKHVEEILRMFPLPRYVWFQLGIYNDDAARRLSKHGIQVVQNRCIMIEHENVM